MYQEVIGSEAPLDITVRARFEEWIDRRGVWPRLTYEEIWNAATIYERERICTAIKEEDNYCAGGDYMLDSNDCIKVACGEWIRADLMRSNA